MNETKISYDQLAKSPAKAIGYNGVSLEGKITNLFDKQFNKPKTTNYNLNIPHDEYYSPQKPHSPYTKNNKQNQSLSDVSSLETEVLEIKELTKLVAEAKILEKKASLKKELESIYNKLGGEQNKSQDKHNSSSILGNTSNTLGFKQRMLENCKLFSPIKAISDPLIELKFFEDRCKIYGITNSCEKFEILQRIWPHSDIIDFIELHEERSYKNLIKFLQGKGSKLPSILRGHPLWVGPVKFQSLYLSAKKYAQANEDDRIKYFMHKHAPNN